MKTRLSGVAKFVLPLAVSLSVFACKDTFDLQPENVLDSSKAFATIYDADAAVLGIYGKVMGIADRYVILNELRGDLEDVTVNADKYLRQINTHTVALDNPWADPRPFFEIVMNCNDALVNLKGMLDNKRISQADYNLRISEVGAIRCWTYLEIGIQYGTVPYITDPIVNLADLQDESKFPKLPFDQLITKLCAAAEALPNKDYLPLGAIPTGSTVFNSNNVASASIDGYNSAKQMFIHKNYLLGELNLWKGDYAKSAHYFHIAMNDAEFLEPAHNSDLYYWYNKVSYSLLNGGSWGDMFLADYKDNTANTERMWALPFDKNFAPKFPFPVLYSVTGKYLIKPSDLSVKNWSSEIRFGGALNDVNRSTFASYISTASGNQIYKFPNLSGGFETSGIWTIFRASAMHLHYSEAVNQLGKDRLAYALLNVGISRTFDPSNVNFNLRISLDNTRDVTTMQQSDYPNFTSDFYFDGRNANFPQFRAPWYRHTGIRQRVGLADARVDSALYFNMVPAGLTNKPVIDRPGLTIAMEDLLIKEGALELAFEGYRWPDLLRIALRRKAIDPNYLGNKIAAKFDAKGDAATAAAIRAKFADQKNWYLPFTF